MHFFNIVFIRPIHLFVEYFESPSREFYWSIVQGLDNCGMSFFFEETIENFENNLSRTNGGLKLIFTLQH